MKNVGIIKRWSVSISCKRIQLPKSVAKSLEQLRALKGSDLIHYALCYYLKPIYLPNRRFYGQPEINKRGVPMCPIHLSGSSLHNLSNANNFTTFPNTTDLFSLKMKRFWHHLTSLPCTQIVFH